MEILASNNFQLIKRDIRILKKHIVYNDNINNWSKIIIIYNAYLVFNQLYALYKIMYFLINNNKNFNDQYRKIFLFFFLLCNLKNSYIYLIINISKIDYNLASSLYNNSKQYFI